MYWPPYLEVMPYYAGIREGWVVAGEDWEHGVRRAEHRIAVEAGQGHQHRSAVGPPVESVVQWAILPQKNRESPCWHQKW